MAMRARTKKGYLTAAGMIVGAFVLYLVGFVVFFAVTISGSDSHSFLIPGETVVTVDTPGEYIIWAIENGMHDGQVYAGSDSLPDGALATVTRVSEGTQIPVLPAGSVQTSASGSGTSTSVARVEIDTPGDYTVSVQGDFSPRIISFGKSGLMTILVSIVLFACVGLLAMCIGLAGATILILTIVGHSRSPRPAA